VAFHLFLLSISYIDVTYEYYIQIARFSQLPCLRKAPTSRAASMRRFLSIVLSLVYTYALATA